MASAILQDQTQIVEFLIQQSADVNAKNRDGGTALHTAAFLGQYEVAELLVQKGADVNAKNEDGETPISSTMADWGTTEFIAGILQLKLDRERVEIGRAQIVELLRQHGVQTDFADPAGDGICKAAGAGDIEAVKQHLAKGMDINTKDGKFGMHPLSWAALHGQSKMVGFLIQQSADVNAKHQDGGTALHTAAFLGRYKTAELLIQKGADVNAKDEDGKTPIDNLKVDWGTTEFVAQLLQIQVDREKVETGRTKVAKLLSQQGANTNFSGPVGSDIWVATGAGDIEAVKQHLAKGMDVDAKNKDGATALHVAAILGQYKVAELLIQKGANVEAKGRDGGTALHAAACLGRSKVAKLLIEKGADIKARNGDGATAMDSLKVDWDTTQFIVQLLQIRVNREEIEAGRAKVAELLGQ